MSGKRSTFALAVGMGLIAGMRSMGAPALLSHYLSRRRRSPGGTAARLLASPTAAGVLKVLAVGEMAADKTPFVPNRTEPPSVVARSISGALCGAAIAEARGEAAMPAALAGAAAALCSTFLMFELRTRGTTSLGVPDLVLALVEDGIVLGAGSQIAASVDR